MALANSVAREDLPSLDVLKWLRSDVLVAGALFEQRLPMQDGSGRSVRVALLSSTRAVVFSTNGSIVDLEVGAHGLRVPVAARAVASFISSEIGSAGAVAPCRIVHRHLPPRIVVCIAQASCVRNSTDANRRRGG